MSFVGDRDSVQRDAAVTLGESNPDHICEVCHAAFTRKTHLTRHLRSHLNQRSYNCTLCGRATFTRSDLLTRHMKRCSLNPGGVPPSRRKACQSCIQRKVKCDLERPCGKCAARGDECVYPSRGPAETVGKEGSPSDDVSAAFGAINQPHLALDVGHVDGAGTVVGTEPNANPLLDPRLSLPMNDLLDPTVSFTASFPVCDPTPTPSREPSPSAFPERPMTHPPGPSPSYSSGQLTPRSNSGTLPAESFFDINSTFLDGFPNQADGFTGFNFPSSFESMLPQATSFVPRALGPAAELIAGVADEVIPDPDRYLDLYYSSHCRHYPFIHLPTLDPSPASPILERVMRACGALYVTGNNAEGRAADQFIVESLQSGLRQQIFRTFTETPSNDIDAQAALIRAMTAIQTLGLFHRSSQERSVSAAFHGMMVTMVRRCGILAFLESWHVPAVETLSTPEAWKSWIRYESMKRIIALAWLHDTLMPIFFNLPPTFGSSEIDLRLPCDDELWEAPTAQQWAELVNPSSSSKSPSFRHENIIMRLRGDLLNKTLANMLSPFSVVIPTGLNRFSSFMTIHALLRDIYLTKSGNIEGRIGIQHGLTQWYISWLSGASGQGPLASSGKQNFTSTVLPLYWMALLWLGQVDPSVPVSSLGEVRFMTIKRWLKSFWSVLRDAGEVNVGVGLVGVPELTGSAVVEEIPDVEGPNNKEADAGLLEWIPV